MLDEAVLERYVGVYELGPGLPADRDPRALAALHAGHRTGTGEAFAESETKFFFKVVDAAIVFTPGPDGKPPH